MTSVQLRSVAFFLGPYRNYTTLIASVLSLHPHCQVLNHAYQRLDAQGSLDFLKNYSEEGFRKFYFDAISLSTSGTSGWEGGSITFSHAFKRPRMREMYEAFYSDKRLKDSVQCLVWKESLLLQKYLIEKNVDLKSLLKKNSKIRFLMPMRNPIECTLSNMKTGIQAQVMHLPNRNFESQLRSVLHAYAEFFVLKKNYPERFFHFSLSSPESLIPTLAEFLSLELEASWYNAAKQVLKIESASKAPAALIPLYENAVKDIFCDLPEERNLLLNLDYFSNYGPSA